MKKYLLGFIVFPLSAFAMTLQEADQLAFRDNLELRAAKHQEKLSRWAYLQKISKHFPSLDFKSTFKEKEASSKEFSGKLELSQTLFEPDLYYEMWKAQTAWRLNETKRVLLENKTLLEVRKAYYGLLAAKEELSVSQEVVDLLKQALTQEKHKLELGDSIPFHVNQTRVSLASALSKYYKAVESLGNKKSLLLRLLGKTPDQPLEIDAEEIPLGSVELLERKLNQFSLEMEVEPISIASQRPQSAIITDDEKLRFTQLSLEYQPQVQEANYDWKDKRLSLDQAKRKYLPTLKMKGAYDNEGRKSQKTPFATRYSSSGSVEFSWKVFDSLARERAIKEKKEALKKSQAQLDRFKLLAQQEVIDRFLSIEQSLLSYVAAEASARLAEQSMDQAKKRRDWGAITSLEFRQATTELASAKRNKIQASYQLLIAYYELLHTCGLPLNKPVKLS